MLRRDFLKLSLLSLLLPACGKEAGLPRIGLALGGGGAKGLAHIPMLEVLDELGLRPHRIAGSSIGAVIGALYADGMSGRELRELVGRLTVSKEESWLDSLFSGEVGRWFEFVEFKLGNGGLLDGTAFIDYLRTEHGLSQFEQLQTPLQVVATDFWKRQAVIFTRGDLSTALHASIAIPGLFEPVQYQGKVLVDGGLVNPVPYDLLFEDCDLVIAVDVLGKRTPDADNGPGYFETSFNTFQIMQAAIMREKRRLREPDIYIRPELENIRVLEFYKADTIYAQAEAERQRLRATLKQRLNPV